MAALAKTLPFLAVHAPNVPDTAIISRSGTTPSSADALASRSSWLNNSRVGQNGDTGGYGHARIGAGAAADAHIDVGQSRSSGGPDEPVSQGSAAQVAAGEPGHFPFDGVFPLQLVNPAGRIFRGGMIDVCCIASDRAAGISQNPL